MTIRIAHETATRLRLRLCAPPELGPRIAARVEALPGVHQVRYNAPARSLIVEHDGKRETRAVVLAMASHPAPPDAVGSYESSQGPDLGQVLVAGAALLATFVLPPPLRALVTLMNAAGVMIRGVSAIANRGLSVEALDAIAITLPTLRGEWRTANFARLLFDLGGYIEASTTQRSDQLLRNLLKARPEMVVIETADGVVRQRALR